MLKLLEFQKRVGGIEKDSTNPFYHSQYFDINKLLSVVKPVLNELGLVLIQPLSHIDGQPALRTCLLDAETGNEIFSDITPLPELLDPQKMGSAITYFRRYAIQSLLALEAVDDDANQTIQTEDEKKKEIASLLSLCSDTKLKTAKDYEDVCLEETGLKLEPTNYDLIIKKLT